MVIININGLIIENNACIDHIIMFVDSIIWLACSTTRPRFSIFPPAGEIPPPSVRRFRLSSPSLLLTV